MSEFGEPWNYLVKMLVCNFLCLLWYYAQSFSASCRIVLNNISKWKCSFAVLLTNFSRHSIENSYFCMVLSNLLIEQKNVLFCHKELCPLSKVFVLINFNTLHCIRITNSFVYMHTYHTSEYVLLLSIIRQTLTHIPTYSLKVNIRMKFCTVPEITSKWNVKMDVCTTRVDAIPKLKFEVS